MSNLKPSSSPQKTRSPAPFTMILRVALPKSNLYPNLMKNEKTGEWSGVCIDILDELKQKANFSYSFVTNDLYSFDDAGETEVIIFLHFVF